MSKWSEQSSGRRVLVLVSVPEIICSLFLINNRHLHIYISTQIPLNYLSFGLISAEGGYHQLSVRSGTWSQ